MVSQSLTKVRPATQLDRQALANLIHFETYVHRHLDWRAPLDWMGFSPYLVAEQDHSILSVLVSPPDPPDVAWIRLFAVSSHISVQEAWDILWPIAQTELEDQPGLKIAAIPLQPWFRQVLEESRFIHTHNVDLLLWQHGYSIPPARPIPASIRPMNFDDLPTVAEVDASAFGPIWRNSLESLEIAYRQAAVATVAENEDGLLGYEISTPSPMGGHLARLAVRPEAQSLGIGYSLVADMLKQFERRGSLRVTVNTQQENTISLSLYEKAGFRETGESYPVYEYQSDRRE